MWAENQPTLCTLEVEFLWFRRRIFFSKIYIKCYFSSLRKDWTLKSGERRKSPQLEFNTLIPTFPFGRKAPVSGDRFPQCSSFLAHSCWKQRMRYCGEADVDGSCRLWTEVVFRRRKLHCGPWREVVSRVTPRPHLVKVKINFDEAQKLTWKEIKCLYGLIKIITSNHVSELLQIQLVSSSRNVHT